MGLNDPYHLVFMNLCRLLPLCNWVVLYDLTALGRSNDTSLLRIGYRKDTGFCLRHTLSHTCISHSEESELPCCEQPLWKPTWWDLSLLPKSNKNPKPANNHMHKLLNGFSCPWNDCKLADKVTATLLEIIRHKYPTKVPLIVQSVKNLSAMQETWILFLGREDTLEKETATHSSMLAWEIPWTEEPGRLQSIGSQELDTT